MNGFKIVRMGTDATSQIICEHGMIDYNPNLKYRVEKRNAYDPTVIHQREPYHEDTFKLTIMISPLQYRNLLSILAKEGLFYLLYTSAGTDMEYPIVVSDLPECPDDLHQYRTKITMILTSRYLNYEPVIDPEDIVLSDIDEMLTIDVCGIRIENPIGTQITAVETELLSIDGVPTNVISYYVGGIDLTEDLYINPTEDYEVSLTGTEGWKVHDEGITIAAATANLAKTHIYVRYNPAV